MRARTKMMLMKQGSPRREEETHYYPQEDYPNVSYREGYTHRQGGLQPYNEGWYPHHLPSPVYRDMGYERPQRIGFAMPEDGYMRYGNEEPSSKHIYMGYAKSSESFKGLNKETAHEWVEHMENSDGSTGPHWSMEQTKATQDRLGIKLNPIEFFAAMNMIYSDYCKVARKFNADNPDFYAHMACAFLEDEDAAPHKLSNYYECIVEH